mgnify:CR=1 FL=1|tara:strand:- start:2409 stop:2762 length:354 start_codon:yes stop_codon:yes gene_type:complete
MCSSQGRGSFGEAATIMFTQQNESKVRDSFAGKVPQSQTDGFFSDMQSRATAMSPSNAGIFQNQGSPSIAPVSSTPARPISEATRKAQAGKQIQPTAKRGTMSPVNKGTAQIKAGNA